MWWGDCGLLMCAVHLTHKKICHQYCFSQIFYRLLKVESLNNDEPFHLAC